jgi:zeaxanthin glucosyltransferase
MMKRILFTVIPEKGHLNPMIGPAVHLQKRGHEVAFYAPRNIDAQLRAVGLRQAGGGGETLPLADLNRGAYFAKKVLDQTWLRDWIKKMLVETVEEQIEPIKEVIRDFKPDVVVTDPMLYSAAIAAGLEKKPWVAVSNSLNPVLDDAVESELLETVKWLAPERARLFARHGMTPEFRGCDLLSPTLTIAFATEAFIGRTIPGVEMVGPSMPPEQRGDETEFPWEKLRRDVPVVYMSMGSQIYYQPALFKKVIRATGDLGWQLVLSVSELLGSDELGALPSHLLACNYIPQLKLLPEVSAFITHGGANSVMEALKFEVPMILSPICNDQFHQAHFVARSGVGRVLNLAEASVTECRATLRDVVENQTIRAALKRVADSYQSDGAFKAAELIESLVLKGR